MSLPTIFFDKLLSLEGGYFLFALLIFAVLGFLFWLVREAIKLAKESQKEGIPAEVRVSKYFFYKSEAGNSDREQQRLQEEVDRLQDELSILAEAYVTPFGRALQNIRQNQKLRLDIMAQRLRMTPSQLSELETSRRQVTIEIIEVVVREFQISEREAVELRDLAKLSQKKVHPAEQKPLSIGLPNQARKDTL